MIRLLRAIAARCFRPDPFGAWWKAHICRDATPEEDACESCREVSCDCTKIKTCNQLHGLPSKSRAHYVQMIGRGPTAFDKHGLPVGRKVGRPTRRT